MDAGLMDAEALRRAVMGLRPCLVFYDIGPEVLDEIRAAAQPQPSAARIDVHPYYLERVDVDALERSHIARQQLQDYLDEAMRAHVLQRLLAYSETLRGLHRDDGL